MSAQSNYIIYLEERLRYVDDLFTSCQAALIIALIELNKERMDKMLSVDREPDLQLYDRLTKLTESASVDTHRKMKLLYEGKEI